MSRDNFHTPFLELRTQWEITYQYTLSMADEDFINKYINLEVERCQEGVVRYMAELTYKVDFMAGAVPNILTRFIEQYVDREKLKKYYLLWNSLNENLVVQCLPIDKIKALNHGMKSMLLFSIMM